MASLTSWTAWSVGTSILKTTVWSTPLSDTVGREFVNT